MRLRARKQCEMLQSNARFARIFDDSHLFCRHFIEKMFDGVERRYLVGYVDDRKYGNADVLWSETSIAHRKGASAEAVFTIEQLNDLTDQ